MDRRTTFSDCRLYRYTLWREWIGGEGFVAFIGLNPSTADEVQDDPTIRRCIGYAKAWGYSAYCMLNLFAWRDTDPRGMKAQAEPVGPDNDRWIREIAAGAGRVIAAWGAHGTHRGRDREVTAMLDGKLHALALTKAGHPGHPLYLKASLTPFPYR